MNHAYFSGTHYEIGFRWGRLLADSGKFLLRQAPVPITQERLRFAGASLGVYREHFPEILEEIRGLAEGQGCGEASLQALLFGMYLPPHCSCFAYADGKQILLGRNSDFLPELEEANLNVLYRFSSGGFSFTGNTTAFLAMEDGVNDQGLSIGLTSVYPPTVRPGMNGGMLLRLFLEKCRSTGEVIARLRDIPVSSAQTFTVADASGDIAVVECFADGAAVVRPAGGKSYVRAVNTFHSPELRHWNDPNRDDWDSEARYRTLTQALDCGEMDPSKAQALLAGKLGFLCQYDRASGKDTVWSVVYDLKGRRVFRAEGNPSRVPFREDRRFPFP